MKSAAIIVILLIASLLLLGIIGFAGLWFSGGKTILLPGLGIVISTRLLYDDVVINACAALPNLDLLVSQTTRC
jgi:hypothetical protein